MCQTHLCSRFLFWCLFFSGLSDNGLSVYGINARVYVYWYFYDIWCRYDQRLTQVYRLRAFANPVFFRSTIRGSRFNKFARDVGKAKHSSPSHRLTKMITLTLSQQRFTIGEMYFEAFGNSERNSTSLSGCPTASYNREDIVLSYRPRHFERQHDFLTIGWIVEIPTERHVIDKDLGDVRGECRKRPFARFFL